MKTYNYSPKKYYKKSLELAKKISTSGFCPDVICGIWRGGATISIIIHEYLKTHIHRLNGIICMPDSVRLNEYIQSKDKILIVDDVLDTGNTIRALINDIIEECHVERELIKVAVLDFKPMNNKTSIIPDFYINITQKWIVYPHEIRHK